MEDETFSDQPDIELDAEIVQRILEYDDAYSERIAALVHFIATYQSRFRESLLERGFIQGVCDVEGFNLPAVDGASALPSHGGGTLVATAAYKSSLNTEKQRGAARSILLPNALDLEPFATLLRMHLELSLLTLDKLDADHLVILDHSFWGVMQAISRALAAYKVQRTALLQAKQHPDADILQQAWKDLFKDCLGLDGSFLHMLQNKRVISLSKKGISQYFIHVLLETLAQSDDKMHMLGSAMNDRALLRHVLHPGEYTLPQPLYHVQLEEGGMKGWRRSRFITNFEPYEGPDPFEARERAFDEYGLPRDDGQEVKGRRLYLTYYLPYQWSRVYRIEFHEILLAHPNAPPDFQGHGTRFQRVLASLRQSIHPEIKEPVCQVLADLRAKAAVQAICSLVPERTFYQLRNRYRDTPDLLAIVDTLLAEERT